MTPLLSRFRAAVSRKGKRGSVSFGSKESAWKRLPSDVFVAIVAYCELEDIKSLALTCRLLHYLVFKNEFAISRAYIERRKQKPGLEGCEISTLPGDDLTFISELFPPPPPHYTWGNDQANPEYSLGYLDDLTRCWTTCVQLSYHLADQVIQHHLETDAVARGLWNSSKTEKEVVFSKAVGMLQAKLLYPIAYAIFFLESSAPPCPGPDSSGQISRCTPSVEQQQSILQKPPFTDTQVLIATHHCMQLLCSTVRRLMSPDFSHSSSEGCVSLLLTTSTLEKIVDFFLAIAKDERIREATPSPSIWSHRKEFMWQMRNELGDYMMPAGPAGNQTTPRPSLDQIWFQVAGNELARRGAIPHTVDDTVPVLHGSVVTLQCKYCYDGE